MHAVLTQVCAYVRIIAGIPINVYIYDICLMVNKLKNYI